MKKIILIASALLLCAAAFAQDEKPEYSYKQTGFASTPKFGAYIIGSYKYSTLPSDNGGPGFNARLIRAYVDGSIFTDFKYRFQMELNGTPHMKDFYIEWAKYKEFSVKFGQFKRAFTFENPMNPWDVGVGDYSQLVKKLAGMGDFCGEASMGGRDQGIQFQGDLLPIGEDEHRLIHYQLGIYNGNGINRADNNKNKDLIGTIQFQPIAGLYVGAFGWMGDWSNGTVTVDRQRVCFGAKYDKNNWTFRTEYATSKGYKASDLDEVTGDPRPLAGDPKADAFYATVGVPVQPWLKVYLKCDQYRDRASEITRHTIYSAATNFWLHKNLYFQLECRQHDNRQINDNYTELWLQTYIRF